LLDIAEAPEAVVLEVEHLFGVSESSNGSFLQLGMIGCTRGSVIQGIWREPPTLRSAVVLEHRRRASCAVIWTAGEPVDPAAPEHRRGDNEGRRRWVERMRAAKAAGQIARFPGGRRTRGLPPLSKDPKIRRAQRIVENQLEMARRKKQLLIPLPPNRGKSSAVARSYNQMLSDIEVCYKMFNRDVLRELKLTSDDFGCRLTASVCTNASENA
jgi:hypothetical protein